MKNPQNLTDKLHAQGYVAHPDLAMALHLALTLGRPLLLEGAAGVGKTEIARALAAMLGTELLRLQCYEGWTPRRPSMNGTTSGNCCPSAQP